MIADKQLAGTEALTGAAERQGYPRDKGKFSLLRLIVPLARVRVAGLAALVLYLLRAAISQEGLGGTHYTYFNYLADAFLHGQLYLRLVPDRTLDLVLHDGRIFLYWPPFPALLLTPLVAVFGVGVSDVLVTAVLGGLSIALLAGVLAALDRCGIAPLSAERRGIIVATIAFGSVVLILAPAGGAWYTGQLVG